MSHETNRPTTVDETSTFLPVTEPTNDLQNDLPSPTVESNPIPSRSPRVSDENEMESRADAVNDVRKRLDGINSRNEELKRKFDDLLVDGELGPCQTLTFLSESIFLTRRIQELLDTLQQMAVNDMREELEELSRTGLPQLLVVSSTLRWEMKLIGGWAGDICGHVKEKTRQIRAELCEVLEKLTGSRLARQPSKTAKKSEQVEDYEIPADGQVCSPARKTLSNPIELRAKIEQIHQVINEFEEARYGQGEIVHRTSSHHVGLHLENLLTHPAIDLNPLNEEAEESKEMSHNRLIDVPFDARDIILQDAAVDQPAERAEPSMQIVSLESNYVRLSSDIETKERNTKTHTQRKVSKETAEITEGIRKSHRSTTSICAQVRHWQNQ